MMKAGQLNQRVKVMRPIRSRDAVGASRVTYRRVIDTWCSIWPITQRESLVAGATATVGTHQIRMRKKAVPLLTADYRLEMNGRVFDITGVVNVEERGEMWQLQAAEHQGR